AHAGHDHQHQFLICNTCGATTELTDHAVAHALEAAAARAGFKPGRMTVEVEGVCAKCQAA
ncbi:MAG: transcriptional repressor, partial [Roseococcus sp.]